MGKLLLFLLQKWHTSTAGDTLWLIARRFNVSVNSIVQLNNITNPNQIYPGMILESQFSKLYGTVEVNGYIEPTVSSAERK